MKKNLIISALFLLFVSCGQKPEFFPTEDWPVSAPEEQGIDSAQLREALVPLLKDPAAGVHSFLLIRNGVIVAEYYSENHDAGTLHALHSTTKSFTGTLIGIAEQQGLLDIDDPVLEYFPEGVENTDELKEQLTIRHLLMMGSGLEWSENVMAYDPNNDNPFLEIAGLDDWTTAILGRKVITAPGSQFYYNSGNSHVLSAIVAKATGFSAAEYAEENLFGPLGITDYIWMADPSGVSTGGWGLQLRPRDMAKLGYLYLNGGVWDGERLLSKRWVREATENQYESGDVAYGYQIWCNDYGYYTSGYGNQMVYVYPYYDLMIVTTGSYDYFTFSHPHQAWDVFWTEFWPAVHKKELPENPQQADLLTESLDALSRPETHPQTVPETFRNLVGQTVFLDRNTVKLSSLTILGWDEQNLMLEVSALDTADDTEKSSVYKAGLDGDYGENGNIGSFLKVVIGTFFLESNYPDLNALSVFMRCSFPDEQTMVLEYEIPGSVVRGLLTLDLSGENPVLIYSFSGVYSYRINGRLQGEVD